MVFGENFPACLPAAIPVKMATMSSGTGVGVGVLSLSGIIGGVWVFLARPPSPVIFSDDGKGNVIGVAGTLLLR